MTLPSHGANPLYLYETLGMETPDAVIDFSENSIPTGPPTRLKEQWARWYNAISSYPDPEGRGLKKLIANKHQVNEAQLLLGNGASELMMTALRKFQGKTVGVIHPAFSEYERVIKANGAFTHHIYSTELMGFQPDDHEIHAFLSEPDRALFICNPNNPTGIRLERETLLSWLVTAEKSGSTLLLDEAFIDMAGEQYSLADYTGSPSLLIFRSMTKMYSIAGLRLGYLLANEETVKEISQWLPHWNVNQLALLGGETVLQDQLYTDEVRSFISKERSYFTDALRDIGFKVSESAANYVCIQPPDAKQTEALWQFLLREGLVLRHTYNYKGLDGAWLRIGMKLPEQNQKLIKAVTSWAQ
ncbi:pyridoxal phosphate-dependent aminotransferase [Jeotgalibacillus salarius]|uniref:Aminotransferase n=1 Tax=Jeotgalibacillus salarius TaxID=546023 RepID=A0A4Y8LQ79_9BACL|nr:aminotransferase class I/II-fold pyridoxal phosphate-dependent enzyme [Jeotgalibacillus salarius]TFE04171.1 pyridoxal phosphate-dependent class II aminotransferase [Jeotgalibacillus salarius]